MILSNAPLVSVCIPAYNAGNTLRGMIDSILAQDYPNIEILVSDNQSDDNTAKIIKEYEEASKSGHNNVLPEVKYFLYTGKPDWQLSEAEIKQGMLFPGGELNWNYVLSLANGEFIALYHADDLYHPSIIRRQVEFMLLHNTSSVFTMSYNINGEGFPVRRRGGYPAPSELKTTSCFDFETLFNMILKYHNFIRTPTLMTRRETLFTVGVFRPKLFLTASDLDLWLRMAALSPIGIINEKLHYYRVYPEKCGGGIRTGEADFFRVMDHYIAMIHSGERTIRGAKVVRTIQNTVIEESNLKVYETQRTLDKLFVINNLYLDNQGKTAKKQFMAIAAKEKLITEDVPFKMRFTRLFIVTFAQYLGNILGLHRLSGKMYQLIRRFL